MSEEDGNSGDGARLWARARAGWRSAITPEAPNPLTLAVYLDDTLEEAERDWVEAWMAASPEALDLMAAAREALGQAPGTAPVSLVSRAQGLVRAPVVESAGFGAWLRGLIAFAPEAWRPLVWAGVTAALLVVSAGGFELGRLGTERLVSVQTAALDDDLELGLDDPADDFI